MKCAICLRIGKDADAITISNGHAMCQTHFRRLHRWQSTSHGNPSLAYLIQLMYQPLDPPRPDWYIE